MTDSPRARLEQEVGQAASASECVNLVLERAPAANGATYHANGGTACYAELGMTGVAQSVVGQVRKTPSWPRSWANF
jgi:hypothetical protein